MQNNIVQKFNYEEMVLKVKAFILANNNNLHNNTFADYFNTELGIDFNAYLQSNEPWIVFEILDSFEYSFNKKISSDQLIDLNKFKWIFNDTQEYYFHNIRDRNLELFKDINIKVEIIANKFLALYENYNKKTISFDEFFLKIFEIFNDELCQYLEILINAARYRFRKNEKRSSIYTMINDVEKFIKNKCKENRFVCWIVIPNYLKLVRKYYRDYVRYGEFAKKRDVVSQKSKLLMQKLYDSDNEDQLFSNIESLSYSLVEIIDQILGNDLVYLINNLTNDDLDNYEDFFTFKNDDLIDEDTNLDFVKGFIRNNTKTINIYVWLDILKKNLIMVNINRQKEDNLFHNTGYKIDFIYYLLFYDIKDIYKERIKIQRNNIDISVL